jgi:glycosyltransferase involved in cell wall biosynthesis
MTAGEGARGPRILHVAAVEYTATALLAPQMRWLRTLDYDVRLACCPDGPRFRSSLAEFQPVELAFPRSGNPAAMARACRRFVQIVNQMRPAVVHLHTPAAALPIRMIPRTLIPRQTRIVYTVHGFAHVWDGGGLRDRVLERVERLLSGRTDLLLFQSREDLDQTRRRGYRTALRYLGNGVEDGWFTIAPRAAPRSPLELLFVGRLIREKGVLDLLEALPSVPGVRLSIVGAELPTERDGVEAAARSRAEEPDLKGRVRFMGPVAKDDMPAVVAACDAMVLPSYREGVPRSLIEGFAASRPAVATDVRGCRELIQDGVTGFLAPPGNPDLLATALRRLVDLSAADYRVMSAAAHDLASQDYRESTVLGRLLDAYVEVGVPPQRSASVRPPVVADDLAGGHLGARAAPQKENGGGSVQSVSRVDGIVQEAQPEQEGADEATSVLRPGQTPNEVVHAPEQYGAKAGGGSEVDLVEPAEQVAVPASGEAGEVVGAGVDLLHERRLGVNQAIVGQNSMNLTNDFHRVENVLEDRLDDDSVDAAGLQGNRMRVGDQLGDVAAVKVESDHLDVVTGVEAVQTVADGATANHEHAATPLRQHVEQP